MLRRALLFLALIPAAHAALPFHRPLPDVLISLDGGKKLNFRQYRGKVLVVAMISTTCSHCVEVAGILNQIQKEGAAHGLQVVAVSGDEYGLGNVRPFVSRYQPDYPVGYVDKQNFIKLANLRPDSRPFVPILMFVDAKGQVRQQFYGDQAQMRMPEPTIRATLNELMKELAPPAPKKAAPAKPVQP
jgi:thiol-disulfide isomerase/thioredoxin